MSVMQRAVRREPASLKISTIVKQNRRASHWIYLLILATTIAVAPLMGFEQLQVGGGLILGGLVAIAVIGLTLYKPVFGFYALAFCAVVIEEFGLATPIGTDQVYVFSWPARLAGLPERPIGFYILLILLFVGAKQIANRSGIFLRGGPLLWPYLSFLACVLIGVVHGMTSGGDVHIIVLEVRPFWYLFVTYLVAYNLVTEKRHVIGFLWILVIGTFFKSLQGVYIVIFVLHGHIKNVGWIMAHEQSYFFVLVLLLLLLCLLMRKLRALMWTIIASLPFLLVALLANNRRADYIAFLLGAVAVWLVAIVVNKRHRKRLIVSFVVCGALAGGYIFAFGFINTPISAPAQSVISIIYPNAADARDTSSNLYRTIEDADLKYTEQQSPIIGYGFGKPFLQPIPLPNIADGDPVYNYIPHNSILWVWMRLGPPGYLALWYLFGAAIVRGGVIIKQLRDPDLQVAAMFALGALLIEIPLAYGDYQLYFYRNVFFVGLCLGILMKLPALDIVSSEEVEPTCGDAVTQPRVYRSRIDIPSARRQSGAPWQPAPAGAHAVTTTERKPPPRRATQFFLQMWEH